MSLEVCVWGKYTPSEILAAASTVYASIPATGWEPLDSDRFISESRLLQEQYLKEYDELRWELEDLQRVEDLARDGLPGGTLDGKWRERAWTYIREKQDKLRRRMQEIEDVCTPAALREFFERQLGPNSGEEFMPHERDARGAVVPGEGIMVFTPTGGDVLLWSRGSGRDGLHQASFSAAWRFMAAMPSTAAFGVRREGNLADSTIAFGGDAADCIALLKSKEGRRKAFMVFPKYESGGDYIPPA